MYRHVIWWDSYKCLIVVSEMSHLWHMYVIHVIRAYHPQDTWCFAHLWRVHYMLQIGGLVMPNDSLFVVLPLRFAFLRRRMSVAEFPGQARGVLRESWYNVNFDMNGVPTMRQHPIYKTPPQNQMILQDFDAPFDAGDYYVQRLTSYLQVNLRFTI